jgi:Phage Terminase
MAASFFLETDAADNCKPSKKKSRERIDGIVALIVALEGASQHEEFTGAYWLASDGVTIWSVLKSRLVGIQTSACRTEEEKGATARAGEALRDPIQHEPVAQGFSAKVGACVFARSPRNLGQFSPENYSFQPLFIAPHFPAVFGGTVAQKVQER